MRPDDRRYEEFLRSLRLLAMGLTRSAARIDRALFYQTRENSKRAVRNIKAEYELERITRDYFDTLASFRLTIEDKKRGLVALDIECVFELHFHCAPPVRKEFAERYTASGLRAVAWPYFRQFVSDVTARMSVPPVTVPLSADGSPEKTTKGE